MVQGDWRYATGDEATQNFIRAVPASPGREIAMALRYELNLPKPTRGEPYLSGTTIVEVRCSDRKTRITTDIDYAGHNLTGRAHDNKPSGAWKTPEPDGVDESILLSRCGEAAAAPVAARATDTRTTPRISPKRVDLVSAEAMPTLYPGVIVGDWTYIDDNDKGQLFARPVDGLAGDNPQLWMRTEFPRPVGTVKALSGLNLTELDCGRHTYRHSQQNLYPRHNLEGASLGGTPTDWEPIIPDSLVDVAHGLVCETAK